MLTEFLNLYEVDQEDYPTKNFNIQSMLNDNFDVLDRFARDTDRDLKNVPNIFMWEKMLEIPKHINYGEPVILDEKTEAIIGSKNTYDSLAYTSKTITVYDAATVDDYGNIVLSGSKTITPVGSYNFQTTDEEMKSCRGKYFKIGGGGGGRYGKSAWGGTTDDSLILYIPPDADVGVKTTNDVPVYVEAYGSQYRTQYAYITKYQVCNGVPLQRVPNVTLSSYNEDAYPKNQSVNESGTSYFYSFRGKWANSITKIVTGSYVGNGKSGESNPNKLQIGFMPKLVMVYPIRSGKPAYDTDKASWLDTSNMLLLINPFSMSNSGEVSDAFTMYSTNVKWLGDGVEWYDILKSSSGYSSNAERQRNKEATTYAYIAIG